MLQFLGRNIPKEMVLLIIDQLCYKTTKNLIATCKLYHNLCNNIDIWERLAQKELGFSPNLFTECRHLIDREIITINNDKFGYKINPNYSHPQSKPRIHIKIVSDLISKISKGNIYNITFLYGILRGSCKGFFILLYMQINWNKICIFSPKTNHRNLDKFDCSAAFSSMCAICQLEYEQIPQ
jgi:hypothetical protein